MRVDKRRCEEEPLTFDDAVRVRVEIDPRVADHADALIETQVRAGLVTRMAVLYDLLTSGPVEVKTESVLGVA